MILQRAGDDLTRGRGVAVDEDDQRHIGDVLAAVRREQLRRPRARADAGDRLPICQKEIGDVESLIEDAARITPEVEHDSLCALVHQAIDVAAKLGSRILAELLEGDVGDLVVEHDRVRHGGDVNFGAHEGVLDGLRDSGAHELDLHFGADGANEHIGDLLRCPAACGCGVDADDTVAFADARLLGRRVIEDAHHDDRAFLLLDLHPDAAVLAGGDGRETLELRRGVELGVWVVELLHESARGLLEELILLERVDEAVAHEREHLVEHVGAIAGGLPLDCGAADDDRQRYYAKQRRGTNSRHKYLEWGTAGVP